MIMYITLMFIPLICHALITFSSSCLCLSSVCASPVSSSQPLSSQHSQTSRIPVQRAYAAERKAIPKYQPAPQHPLLETQAQAQAQGGAAQAKTPATTSPTKPATTQVTANPLFDDPLSSALAQNQPTKPAASSLTSSSDGISEIRGKG